MHFVRYIIRFLLALLFVYAGIEKLFLPYDPSVFKTNTADSNPAFFEFYHLLQSVGYLYFVGFFQALCGLCLIFRKTQLLGSIMLIPLILCLWMTHVFFSKNAFYLLFDGVIFFLNIMLIMPHHRDLQKVLLKPQKSWI
ncbi:MauE/DoxX family redox-associated membrane protein [uncultured Microscilla sp.]|uniref:MauE/DoxX family redox-associated membrane protein n=1 Tax=uncultured Microscilla sp. TaxID=432653 RepID=UPI003456C27E